MLTLHWGFTKQKKSVKCSSKLNYCQLEMTRKVNENDERKDKRKWRRNNDVMKKYNWTREREEREREGEREEEGRKEGRTFLKLKHTHTQLHTEKETEWENQLCW